jgi:hypothetical protein
LLLVSAMNTSPAALTATACGASSWTWVANPPGPVAPGLPVPANWVMMPVAASILRITLSSVSAM